MPNRYSFVVLDNLTDWAKEGDISRRALKRIYDKYQRRECNSSSHIMTVGTMWQSAMFEKI